MFHIIDVEKNSAILSELVSELDAFQTALYPAESDHCIDLTSIPDESLRCIVVRDEEGATVGCGAVLLSGDGVGEVKRVYIRPAYRGKKLGELIVARLETIAADSGCRLLRLETGIRQQPAIVLYHRCGYEQCGAFAPYIEDSLSVFMWKQLNSSS
jgi:putative acetyltransferase